VVNITRARQRVFRTASVIARERGLIFVRLNPVERLRATSRHCIYVLSISSLVAPVIQIKRDVRSDLERATRAQTTRRLASLNESTSRFCLSLSSRSLRKNIVFKGLFRGRSSKVEAPDRALRYRLPEYSFRSLKQDAVITLR